MAPVRPGAAGLARSPAWASRARALLERSLRVLWANAGTLSFLVLAGGVLAWVTFDAFWVRMITNNPGSDYWEHAAAIRALMEDPWHPPNPHLASSESSPRFVPVFLLAALVSRWLSLDALDGMALCAVWNTALFLAGIYAFFRVYFRSSWAPAIGLVVLFGSWWNAWHFSNVYQLSIYFSVASYPSTTTLGATLLLFALVVSELRAPRARPAALVALCAGWAFVLITHPLTAMMAISGGLVLAATLPSIPLERRALVGATVAVGAVLVVLWPYFSTYEVLRGGKGSSASWVKESVREVVTGSGGGDDRHMFYKTQGLLNTLGFALIGIPVGIYLLLRKSFFIPLGVIAMATPFIANMYVSVPLGHRFILLAVFYLQLAVVWLLLRCLPRRPSSNPSRVRRVVHWVPALLVSGIVGYLGWRSVENARARFAYNERRYGNTTSAVVRLGERVAEAAGPGAVVLADLEASWSLPVFGPKVVALKHQNPLVVDERAREAAVRRFLRPNTRDEERLHILSTYGVTHVLVKRRQERAVSKFLSQHARRKPMPSGYSLYTLRRS